MCESAPMHAEASRSVDFAEQPERELIETSHAPSDALVVVDRVGSRRASIRGQLVRDQAPGPAAVKQFAQTKIKPQSFLSSPEASLVFHKHRRPFSWMKIMRPTKRLLMEPANSLSHLHE